VTAPGYPVISSPLELWAAMGAALFALGVLAGQLLVYGLAWRDGYDAGRHGARLDGEGAT
jgi:hypothetical protein